MFPLIILLLLASKLQPSLQKGGQRVVVPVTKEHKKEIVNMHNFVRTNVKPTASNMLKMKWSEEMRKHAEGWAGKCQAKHRTIDDLMLNGVALGENTFQGNYPIPWTFVMAEWYKTKSAFKYGFGSLDPKKIIAPYTQMVWHKTQTVGCAVSYCPKNSFKFFYVCHYYPTGNTESEMPRPYKKGRPCGKCPDACEDKLCVNTTPPEQQ